MVSGYSEAVKSLWSGRATVTVLDDGTLNESNGRTVKQEITLYNNLPCRISHGTVKSTDSQNNAAVIAQSTTLYIDRDLIIPEGAKITVTQNGVTKDYCRSGKSAVYTSHQEIPLELYQERA